jgi:hypothetical protein
MSSRGFANFSQTRKNPGNLISSIENIELMEIAR